MGKGKGHADVEGERVWDKGAVEKVRAKTRTVWWKEYGVGPRRRWETHVEREGQAGGRRPSTAERSLE